MNVFTFTGNLGRDATVRDAGSAKVCNFSVAVKSGYGDKAQTIWVDVSVWGKQAEGQLPSYLLKGQQVAISGEMGTREHEGKTYITCRADPGRVDLIGKRDDSAASAPAPRQQAPTPSAPPAIDLDDDIPF